jgi:hypothetical protein
MANEIITRAGIDYFLYNKEPIEDKVSAKELLASIENSYLYSRLVASKQGYHVYVSTEIKK